MLGVDTLRHIHIKMKCYTCGKKMKSAKVKFNRHTIEGWKCSCGEVYYEPEQAERILLFNKVKKVFYRVKLNKVKSNLILRIPKEVGEALNFHAGEEVSLSVKEKGIIVQSKH